MKLKQLFDDMAGKIARCERINANADRRSREAHGAEQTVVVPKEFLLAVERMMLASADVERVRREPPVLIPDGECIGHETGPACGNPGSMHRVEE